MTNEREESSGAEAPLESWKGIAAYLQRDVRTVIRWEKSEGLPVHRHHHLSRSSVYAYATELDLWRAHRQPTAEPAPSYWWRPIPALACTAVIALMVMMAGGGPRAGALVHAAAGIETQQVWTGADGAGAPSPDGKYFTCIDWKSGNLAIRETKTGKVRLLTQDGTWKHPMQMAGSSIWFPDGKRVAYFWEGPGELRAVDIENPRPKVLYREPAGRSHTLVQFTADGRAVLTETYRAGQPGEIGLISLEDASMRVLTTVDQSSFHSSLSPDGRYVAYDRAPENDFPARDLYLMRPDGSGETRLLAHPADDSVLGWVPGSDWLLFISDRTGASCIYGCRVRDGKLAGEPVLLKHGVGKIAPSGFTRDGSFYYAVVKAARDVYVMEVDPDTGKVVSPPRKEVLSYEGSNQDPQYSPDGRYLAYISKRGNAPYPTNRGNTLCVRSLDSGEERVFYKEFGKLGVRYLLGPEWSPDSRKILLGVEGKGGFGLHLVDPKTAEITDVMRFPEGVGSDLYHWSPDGKSLYYVRRNHQQRVSWILHRELATGTEHELRELSGSDGYRISLSPDGRRVAFSNAGDDKKLQVMPVEGGEARLLFQFEPRGYGVPHTWTPDGRFILFTTGANKRTLCRIPAEGGKVQELWPNVLSLGPISVHPDGRHIAFAAATEIDSAQDIWVMRNFLPEPGASGGRTGR